MKKLTFSILLNVLILQAFGQDTIKNDLRHDSNSNFKNELGINLTPFIKYYTDSLDNSNKYNFPDLILTYRRYLKKINVRVAIGGNYMLKDLASPAESDSARTIFYNEQGFVTLRVGFEYFQNLSRRWQIYYGLDLSNAYSFQKNDIQSTNFSYAIGLNEHAYAIGVAPILGIRFKMNNRMSLIAESSFLIRYSKTTSLQYYTPLIPLVPPRESEPTTHSTSFESSFRLPLSIILTVSL